MPLSPLSRRAACLGLLALAPLPALAAPDVPTPNAPTPAAPTPAATPPLSPLDQTIEALRLQAALTRDVPHLATRTPASDAAWITLARAELARANTVLDHPQLLVVVDRSPHVQQLAIVLATPNTPALATPNTPVLATPVTSVLATPADTPSEPWRVIGGTHVSTGSMGRFDHYITPRGVFHVTPAILGFRAEGTLNENGIRGLGAKGMRVWDFGWQVAAKGWKPDPGKPDRTPIRLMLHATDPDKLEQRIGQPASQGCIRIPTAMNRFLDHHGVLDAEYERAATTELRFRALLPPDRKPSPLAGNTLVVVDSSDKGSVNMASRAIP